MNITIILAALTIISTIIAITLGYKAGKQRFKADTIIADITKLLDREGFNWGKDEGELFVEKKGHRFDIHMEHIPERDCARVHFIVACEENALNNISELGRLTMAAQLNERHLGSFTAIRPGAFRTIISADIRNAQEFYTEFQHTYGRMAHIASDFGKLLQMAEREFPAKKESLPHIGFAA